MHCNAALLTSEVQKLGSCDNFLAARVSSPLDAPTMPDERDHSGCNTFEIPL